MDWEIVIGLEIHAQLATASKIFSGAATRYGAAPNTQASLLDLGYPGTLPVLNAAAVRMAIKFGLATGCDISRRSVFARKNYVTMKVNAAANGHQTTGSRLISLRAKLIMPPKLFIEGSTPTPTYDNTASYRISEENSSTVTISIRWATFGNT